MRTINNKKYTTKEDLQNKFFGIEEYKPGKTSVNGLFIKITSGTTRGIPSMVMVRVIVNKVLLNFLDKYSKACLLLHAKNSGKFRSISYFLTLGTKAPRVLSLDKKDIGHPLIGSMIDDFDPQMIDSTVSVLNFLIDKLYIKKTLSFPKKINKLYIASEAPSKEFLIKLKKMFPKSELRSYYAISETAYIGISCKHLIKKYKDNTFGVYHPIRPTSIVEPDQIGVGEISVYTRELSNYLTGDAGKLIKEKCRCGESRTLFLYGRINYDIVNCVGAVFHIKEVERVFSNLNSYVKDYLLEIKEIFEEGKTYGSVTIKIIPTIKLEIMENGQDFISEFVKKHLQLTKTRHLGDLIRDGIFLPPRVVYVTSFPDSAKKIRMRKID
ncbi:MAG: hypothetical protein AAB513_00425 [Patescibacteria group bacterium]